MIYELNHFGIVVRDLEKSLEFYQGALGAEVIFRGLIPGNQTDVIYLQIHGGIVELLHRADPAPDEKFGITHIAFLSNDLDKDFADLIAAGYEPLVQPKVAGTGVGRLSFLRDPNGARLELLERDLKMRVPHIDHPVVKGFDHYSIITGDLAASEAFYIGKLGMKQLTRKTMSSGMEISYLHYDYDVLELLDRPTKEGEDVFGHIALRVDDMTEALAILATKGILPREGTPKPAGSGVGSVAMLIDPDGVKVELLDRPDLHE